MPDAGYQEARRRVGETDTFLTVAFFTERGGLATMHDSPLTLQQFSVKNPTSPFMASMIGA